MQRDEIFARMNDVFREVFEDDTLTVTDATTAADIDGWDSLAHITLLNALSAEFGVRFGIRDALRMQNVGQMADFIAANGR